MKVLFLDIDGVLNSEDFYRERHSRGKRRVVDSDEICPTLVDNLNSVLREAGCAVVLSSTWRKFTPLKDMVDILRSKGCAIQEFAGATPVLDSQMENGLWHSPRRGSEIQAWLDDHPSVSKFVIVDDDSDMDHLAPFLVKTQHKTGLTKEKAQEIIQRLQ